jgi:MFS family permease
VTAAGHETRASAAGIGRLWDRQLHHYPDRRPRVGYLAVVVISSIVLYYQQYVGGAVSPAVLAHFQISFRYYLTVVVIASVAGAVSSLLAGFADRWGRANLVVWGLLAASLITAIGIPSAPDASWYAIYVAAVGFVEGMVLVATPALVRDFSPQLRRGTAMGLWTLGPVIGSLIVSEVASNTLDHLHAWQDQFHIAGITGLVVFVLALLTLRELSPALRVQVMVSGRERALIEARARGIDLEATLRHPWRQMVGVDIVVPALGVSLFLLIYYAAVGFFVIYFSSVFGFSQARANGLGNWFWAADAVTVVVIGVASDRIGVRKPFMVAGGAGAVVMTAIFATRATHPATTYTTFIVIVSFLSASRGMAYAPWMAAFTETVERRNPALVATGLAIWGWVLRIVVAISFLVIPFVVTSATPVVNYAPTLQAIQAQYPTQIATIRVLDPATRAQLQAGELHPVTTARAVREISARQHVPFREAVRRLLAIKQIPAADRAYLQAHGQEVLDARKAAPEEWQRWWWVCVGGEILFLPTILLLAGRWRPSRARRDTEDHNALVDTELAQMAITEGDVPEPAGLRG